MYVWQLTCGSVKLLFHFPNIKLTNSACMVSPNLKKTFNISYFRKSTHISKVQVFLERLTSAKAAHFTIISLADLILVYTYSRAFHITPLIGPPLKLVHVSLKIILVHTPPKSLWLALIRLDLRNFRTQSIIKKRRHLTSIVLFWITSMPPLLTISFRTVLRRVPVKCSIMLMTWGASKVIYTLLQILSKMYK